MYGGGNDVKTEVGWGSVWALFLGLIVAGAVGYAIYKYRIWESDVVKERKFAGNPALSATGACRLFAKFQKRFCSDLIIYFPDPTWSNHSNIWRHAHIPDRTFRYYHPNSKGLNFVGLLDDVKCEDRRCQVWQHIGCVIIPEKPME